jgi:hypothetical protein
MDEVLREALLLEDPETFFKRVPGAQLPPLPPASETAAL